MKSSSAAPAHCATGYRSWMDGLSEEGRLDSSGNFRMHMLISLKERRVRDKQMDIKDLQYFHVVYEERSINRAAGKLFISSQGLSKIILKLEEELKTTLFERSKKGVRPTESAVFLYEKAEEIIRQYEEIRHGSIS